MNQMTLEAKLADLPLGAVRYFDRVGSTNDEASRWATQGAPDMALVVADEQTAGKGRAGHSWYTPPGASLAFSLVLYPSRTYAYISPRMTALGALAVKDALEKQYQLRPQIKWPNDVLLERRKVAGILTEAHWTGGTLAALILGIGINVASASVNEAMLPQAQLPLPATSVETALGRPVDRLDLLHAVLMELLNWRPRLASPEFLQAWEASLAFRGEWIQVTPGESAGKDGLPLSMEKLPPPIGEGQILGLTPDGSLKLRTPAGDVVTAQVGEIRLRPK